MGFDILDPNIVYLLLLFSLWSVVTAAYLPGTGLIEVLSGAFTLGAVYLLAQLPTNWGSVLLIVVGVLGFLIMPFINQRWAMLAYAGLILQAIGSFLLFAGMSVAPVIIVVVIALSVVYHQFALTPILRKHRDRNSSENDSLIGSVGRVVQPLTPVGSVDVRGETWTARSQQQPALNTDDEIIVLARDGLMLTVEGVKHKREDREDTEIEV